MPREALETMGIQSGQGPPPARKEYEILVHHLSHMQGTYVHHGRHAAIHVHPINNRWRP